MPPRAGRSYQSFVSPARAADAMAKRTTTPTSRDSRPIGSVAGVVMRDCRGCVSAQTLLAPRPLLAAPEPGVVSLDVVVVHELVGAERLHAAVEEQKVRDLAAVVAALRRGIGSVDACELGQPLDLIRAVYLRDAGDERVGRLAPLLAEVQRVARALVLGDLRHVPRATVGRVRVHVRAVPVGEEPVDVVADLGRVTMADRTREDRAVPRALVEHVLVGNSVPVLRNGHVLRELVMPVNLRRSAGSGTCGL